MNNIPKEIIIKRKDVETLPRVTVVMVAYGLLILLCLFCHVPLLDSLYVIGAGLLGVFLLLMIPKLFKEDINEVFFSVQEWGITVVESGIRYRLEWWQIERLYEKKERVWITVQVPRLSVKFLYIEAKNKRIGRIRCTCLMNCIQSGLYRRVEEAVTYYSQGRVPYVRLVDKKK